MSGLIRRLSNASKPSIELPEQEPRDISRVELAHDISETVPPCETLPVGPEQLDLHTPEVGDFRQPTAAEIVLTSSVSLGSVLGVLARIGIINLETYAGAPATPFFWVQLVGCVVMGFIHIITDCIAPW